MLSQIIMSLALISSAATAISQELPNIQIPNPLTNGQVANADDVNQNFQTVYERSNELKFGMAPLGSILPWHKSLNTDIGLPSNWVECNGQTLSDPESPYHNRVIPDLNGASPQYANRGLFVRGATTSGSFQEDQIQSHKHDDQGHTHDAYRSGGSGNGQLNQHWGIHASNHSTGTGRAQLTDPVESTQGAVRHGTETRPVNISMVWIMRIK